MSCEAMVGIKRITPSVNILNKFTVFAYNIQSNE